MNDKLEEYGDELIDLIQEGQAFVGEQAPLFVQELLTYYTYHHSIYAIGALVILTTTSIMIKWTHQAINAIVNDPEKTDQDNAGLGVGLIFLYIGALISLIVLIGHSMSLLKITVAPRLYLIERLTIIMY